MSIRQRLVGIVVLATSSVVLAQTTETKPPDKDTSATAGSVIGQALRAAAANKRGYSATSLFTPCPTGSKAVGQAEILTDTLGVDFGPYLTQVTKIVRQNWYQLIPPSAYPPILKQGKVSIELHVLKDGKVNGMAVHASSGDVALDRAARGSITASTPFAALPTEFHGQLLGLRFYFFYNLPPDISVSPISISPCADVRVPVGSTLQFSASGKGITDTSVTWSVWGFGCSQSACGTISDSGLYTAPVDIPSPPTVIVDATSRTNVSTTGRSKLTVVQAAPSH
jgi:TonB family protein